MIVLELALAITAIVASLCSCFVSCFHAWIDYRRAKEKDPLWEAALNLTLKSNTQEPEELVRVYEDLLFYKEHRDIVLEHGNSISRAKLALSQAAQSGRAT